MQRLRLRLNLTIGGIGVVIKQHLDVRSRARSAAMGDVNIGAEDAALAGLGLQRLSRLSQGHS